MKKGAFGLLFCVSAALFSVSAQAMDGKDVFTSKCASCHTVSSAGITGKKMGGDLTDVTVRHQKDWVRKYIKKETPHVSCDKSKGDKLHMTKFSGSQHEEDALIEWLDKQRSK